MFRIKPIIAEHSASVVATLLTKLLNSVLTISQGPFWGCESNEGKINKNPPSFCATGTYLTFKGLENFQSEPVFCLGFFMIFEGKESIYFNICVLK